MIEDSGTGEEVATIIQAGEDGTEVSLEGGVEEGEMTIHISEEALREQEALGQVSWLLLIPQSNTSMRNYTASDTSFLSHLPIWAATFKSHLPECLGHLPEQIGSKFVI